VLPGSFLKRVRKGSTVAAPCTTRPLGVREFLRSFEVGVGIRV
jgi:hypothetical protein